MLIAEQLRAAGVPTFPCGARYNDQKGRWDKWPQVPKGESWQLTARRPFDDPALNWSSGFFGVPVPAGVLILDVDSYKGATRKLVEQYLGCRLEWGRALVQNTISGGQHYAFRCDWPARQSDSLDGVKGFDTRVAGKGFIASGQGYTPVGFGLFALAYPQQLPSLPSEARAVLEQHAPPEREAPAPLPTDDERNTQQVVEALRHIDPGTTRDEWVRVGLALRHYYHDDEPTGMDLFDRWSAGEYWPSGAPENYVPGHVPHQWGSFKPEGATTIATLFYRAIQSGWVPPASFDTSAAFGDGPVDGVAFQGLVERIRESGGDITQTADILGEIRGAGCNALQVALLAAELKNALKDAGIKDGHVGKLVDQLLAVRSVTLEHPGSKPEPGQVLDDNTPLHPSSWAPMQTKGKDMKPKGTLRNFEIMLQAYGVQIQFDEIGKTLRMTGPTMPGKGVLHEEAALSYLDSLANLNDYPTASVKAMIMPVANKHTINPVRQWIEQAPWGGQDHVGHLWSQITLEDGEDAEFCELLFRKWLRGAYAIGTGLIDRWEHVIVLVDPNGGAGKTRFFSTLCPQSLRTDSVILDTANKDSVKMAISYWLTELGELDGTFSRSESAKIKAFLSQQKDEMRLPYGRAYLEYPRRTAFFASVNENHFLIDPSDNRRIWGIRVAATNHTHNVDMQQVWAQVAHEVSQGQIGHLTPQEDQTLRMRNEGFRTSSPIADALSGLVLGRGEHEDHKTVTEILAVAGIGRPNKADLNEAARWLRRAGWHETRKGGRRGFCVTVEPLTAPAFKPAVVT